MNDLYQRYMRHASNMELSPGQRAYWQMMALRVKMMGG